MGDNIGLNFENWVSNRSNYTKFVKNGVNAKLELDLIVNKNDEEKVQVANIIKNNLSSIGVSINVEKLSEAKLNKKVKAKDKKFVSRKETKKTNKEKILIPKLRNKKAKSVKNVDKPVRRKRK